jgi:tRNA pseudouridine38-40 synthase
MSKFLVEIKYDGKKYFGWQRQPRQISVQEVIEMSLQKLFGEQKISVVGCGRTDTGVHAIQYFFDVNLSLKFSISELHLKLNKILPQNISVQSIKEVPDDFHSRFDAKLRTYRYFVHTEKNPFLVDKSLYFPQKLNVEFMNEATKYLIGTKDFSSFSKSKTDVNSNICTIYSAHWKCNKDENTPALMFEISANRFLRNMVRAIVGTLLEVGTGKINPKDVEKIIQSMDRSQAKVSVKAHGLFLWEVKY